jgi:hypothetical protein
MIRIGHKIIIAGATALILAAGAGVATAATMSSPSPVDSSGVIHGCWTNAEINGSHFFVLQDAGTSCPKGTTAISWNQQGPAGPTGPAGPAGPTGAAGPTTAGPGGLDVTVVTDGDSYIGDDYDFATAECPASAPYVVGGEASSVGGAGGLTASVPYDFTTGLPVNGTNPITGFTGAEVSGDAYGWVGTIPYGSQTTGLDGGLTVYALCSA